MMQQQHQQQYAMNANDTISYQYDNQHVNVMDMESDNTGPFFWWSMADTPTFSNSNNCDTWNTPLPIPPHLLPPQCNQVSFPNIEHTYPTIYNASIAQVASQLT